MQSRVPLGPGKFNAVVLVFTFVLGLLQTSIFSCTELNTYLDRPK